MSRGVRPQGAEEVSDAERRRGIALVLDRQPEIDLDELQRILARVGIVVDADTLVDDLDALGFDVDDEPVGDPDELAGPSLDTAGDEDPEVEADADADADAEDDALAGAADPDAAHPEAAHPDAVDAFAEPTAGRPSFLSPPPPRPDGEDADEPPGEGSWSRQSLVVAAALVVVVIIVAVFLAGGSDDDAADDTTAGADDTSATAQAGGTTAPGSTGPTEPVRVAPTGPGSDPALEGPETRTDDFERGEIGDYPNVGTWQILSGEWTNTDGNLDATSVPEGGVGIVAVDVGVGDVRAQVQIDRRASRSGIAFRIVDERNFLIWSTVPEYATTILFEVVDGEATPVTDSGLTPTGDGLPALGINLVGNKAELLNDGVVVAVYEDLPPAEGATRIGVAALGDVAELPLFDEYEILTPPA